MSNKNEPFRNLKVQVPETPGRQKDQTQTYNGVFHESLLLWDRNPHAAPSLNNLINHNPPQAEESGPSIGQMTPVPDAAETPSNCDQQLPQLSASFWMDIDSSSFIPSLAQPEGSYAEPSFASAPAEGFEMWSAAPSGNEFVKFVSFLRTTDHGDRLDDWSSYLLEVEQMVKGMQDVGEHD